MAKKLYYKIGEACKMLGIEAYVLRYWETEFPFLSPTKSRSGQRVYGEEELGLIRRIKELLYEEGYTIAGAKRKLEAELENGTLAPVEVAAEVPPEPVKPPPRKTRPAPAETSAPVAEAGASEAPEPIAAVVEVDEATAPALDTTTTEEIQRLRSGLEVALQQARDVLRLLDASA